MPEQDICSSFDGAVDLPSPIVETGRRIGYARVSKTEQETALQMAALRAQGCDLIFEEKVSSVSKARPAFEACLDQLRPGDTLVVWKLDRLGRNAAQLIILVSDMEKRGIQFVCITQGFDTSTPMGKAFLGILAVFAQLERDQIIERTNAGLEVARQMGHFGGARPVLMGDKLAKAKELYFNRPINPVTGRRYNNQELADLLGVAKATMQRYVLHDGMPTRARDREIFLAKHGSLENYQARWADPNAGKNPNKRRY
jgi:DNA invertase Pin-like site-specific DNA recombinase